MSDSRPTGLAIAFGAAIVGLILSLGVSLYNLDLLRGTAERAQEVGLAIDTLDGLVDALTDVETGQRGYLLTGEGSYLEPYHTGLRRIGQLNRELPVQLDAVGISPTDPRVISLVDAVEAKRKELTATVGLYDDKGGKAAVSVIVTDVGLKMMRDVQRAHRTLRAELLSSSQEASRQSDEARRFANIISLVATFCSILLVGVSFFLADRQQLLRRRAGDRAERYATRLTALSDIALQLNQARDRPSLLGMVANETRRLLSVEVAAAVIREDEGASSAVAVGARATAMSRWKPDLEPLEVGLEAEEAGSLALFSGDGTAPALLSSPGDIQTAAAVALTDRSGAVFGHLVAAEPIGDSLDRVGRLSLVQLAQLVSVAWENVLLLEELQDAATEREHFMAMLGHELRNPLNAIAGASQVLARKVPEEAPERQLVAMLDRQAGLMRRMVEDLLDVARLERGKFDIQLEALDLAALTRRIADDFQTGREHGDLLDVEVPALPLFIEGDRARISQCVNNLLDNALKFGAGKRIRMVLAERDGSAVLAVADQGVGIPVDQLESVFDRYAQGSEGTRRDGLGLGLALVHGVTELHGGSVVARSRGPGTGTEIEIRLPLGGAGTVEPAPSVGAPQPRDILVVDDRADARLALSEMLQDDGHRVSTAGSGREALDLLKSTRPDVVFCDISMGDGIDGYEVARTLRASGDHDGLVLIALTGFGTMVARERSLEAGFDEHLTKPIDLDGIRHALHRAERR